LVDATDTEKKMPSDRIQPVAPKVATREPRPAKDAGWSIADIKHVSGARATPSPRTTKR